MRVTALSLLLLSSPGFAAEPVSFEGLLGQVRETVLKTRSQQVQVKDQNLAREINAVSSRVDRWPYEVQRTQYYLKDLQRRAQRLGQAKAPNDTFLRSDLQRFVWDLQRFARDAQGALRDAERVSRQVQQKDPDLVHPAQSLLNAASDLESRLRWLESDARFARWDFQRAGYTFEGSDIERACTDSHRAAQDLAREARDLLAKVR